MNQNKTVASAAFDETQPNLWVKQLWEISRCRCSTVRKFPLMSLRKQLHLHKTPVMRLPVRAAGKLAAHQALKHTRGDYTQQQMLLNHRKTNVHHLKAVFTGIQLDVTVQLKHWVIHFHVGKDGRSRVWFKTTTVKKKDEMGQLVWTFTCFSSKWSNKFWCLQMKAFFCISVQYLTNLSFQIVFPQNNLLCIYS